MKRLYNIEWTSKTAGTISFKPSLNGKIRDQFVVYPHTGIVAFDRMYSDSQYKILSRLIKKSQKEKLSHVFQNPSSKKYWALLVFLNDGSKRKIFTWANTRQEALKNSGILKLHSVKKINLYVKKSLTGKNRWKFNNSLLLYKNPYPPKSSRWQALYRYILDDPFIYQRLLIPVHRQLLNLFKYGKFDKRRWLKNFYRVVRLATAHYVRKYGRPHGREVPFTTFDKIKTAAKLASDFWHITLGKK